MNFAAIRLDHTAITVDHAGNLFALVRVYQKHYFVVTHNFPLGLKPPVRQWSKDICLLRARIIREKLSIVNRKQ
jgi:hypothetical protein